MADDYRAFGDFALDEFQIGFENGDLMTLIVLLEGFQNPVNAFNGELAILEAHLEELFRKPLYLLVLRH